MNGLLWVALVLAMAVYSSGTWCICKEGVSDAALQKTLDYACGAGADCTLIHPNGVCFNPNTVRAHCSYAVNSYFQKKGQAQGACDFSATATTTASDPSYTGCAYPASASSNSTSTTNSSTTPFIPTSGGLRHLDPAPTVLMLVLAGLCVSRVACSFLWG
ncbi:PLASMODESMATA CALLOSE-BINDING PROTEIN 3-like [Actinidia eriantha]|uniref:PLASMODESMATA CALLOSE-BINDING PROTEIN 3-like n=1 Tax=Actinidia eriantha TaxID=165200 RepID=UPI002585623F|nr:PLASMODESMATA CALLOSE-BINDING PROTEIN 3-like [Actinidia eriantha]